MSRAQTAFDEKIFKLFLLARPFAGEGSDVAAKSTVYLPVCDGRPPPAAGSAAGDRRGIVSPVRECGVARRISAWRACKTRKPMLYCYRNRQETGVKNNRVFSFGQAVRKAGLTGSRPTAHGPETNRMRRRFPRGLSAGSGMSTPRNE